MATDTLTDSLQEALAAFEDGTPRSTTEVATALDLGRRSTYDRLDRLAERGRLETKKVGAKARVWWEPRVEPAAESDGQTSHARRDRREEFKSLVEAVEEYAIFTLGPDGRIRTWNPGAERIKGYEADEIIGEHFGVFYTQGDRADGVPADNLAAAADRGAIEDEGWRVRADGTRFWANVTITAIRDDDGDLAGYAKVTRDMTERRAQEERVRREREVVEQILETNQVGLGMFSRAGLEEANARMAEIYGDRAEGPGEWDGDGPAIYDEDGEPVAPNERPAARVFDTGEPVDAWECQVEASDGNRRWLSVSAAPIEAGDGEVERVVVVAEDVTRLKEQAQVLERERDELEAELDEVFARIDDAFYALDEDFQFTYVNEQAETLLDHSQGELLGRSVWEVFSEATETPAHPSFHRALDTQEPTSFEMYLEQREFWVESNVYPSRTGLSVYFRDVTERKERERELERYETLFEESKDVNVVVDAEGTFQYVTPSVSSVFGYDQEELVGENGFEYVHPDDLGETMDAFAEMVEDPDYEPKVEFRFRHGNGSWITVEAMGRNLLDDPDIQGIVVYTRDVTERKERERELERYRTIVETMSDGVYVVDETGRFRMGNEAYLEMVGLSKDELIGAHVTDVVDQKIAAQAQTVEGELQAGERDQARLVTTLQDADGEPIEAEATFALLPVDEAGAVERVGVVRDVTERQRRERELRRQREQLAALNNLNEVAREVTSAVIEQSTRAEIESTVCERLAASDSYEFAWIGSADAAAEEMAVQTAAGADGYLDDQTIGLDPDGEAWENPTTRALRTGEVQVREATRADETRDPWLERLEEYGFQSAAAIPIVHENTVYGVLTVYSERTGAFAERERTVVAQIGEIVGHAIAAAIRKRALLADEVVEVEFLLPDVFEAFGVEAKGDGEIRLHESVPIGEDEYVAYGTATEGALPDLRAIVDATPQWGDLTVREDALDVDFEIRLSDPPLLSAVASLGGSIEEVVIEDGDYRITVHAAPSADVENLVDVVTETYSDAEMVAHRQIERSDGGAVGIHRVLAESLTDRQDAALRAAYNAGFFEWPRDVDGETVAASLGVASSTFSQHLRKAEKKVFDALLSS